jgi:hypothetical protein
MDIEVLQDRACYWEGRKVSGGFIEQQGDGDHQVVTFTFVGKLTKEKVDQWNKSIMDLKQRFGNNLIGITTIAESTSPERLAEQKRPPGGG